MQRYCIVVDGHVDKHRWSEWFEGWAILLLDDGCSRIEGSVEDQAALYSVLSRIRDMGLRLVSITRCDK